MEGLYLTLSIVSVVFLIIIIVLMLVLYFKKSNKEEPTNNNEGIVKSLDALNASIEDKIKSAVSDKLSSLYRSQQEDNEKELKRIGDLEKSITETLNKSFKDINDRVDNNLKEGFKSNAETIKNVNESLGRLDEARKNLDALQTEVTSLNNVLSNNSSLGKFGELSLENLLHEVFGETSSSYAFQYKLTNKFEDTSKRPDAVVFMPEPINTLCIDSKFNFLTYQKLFENEKDSDNISLKRQFRDGLKAEIMKISNDYIIKGKTAEYAILYIPSDGIYTYIASDDELYSSIFKLARNKKVVLSSPSTLQPILANLNVLKFNISTRQNIDQILKELNSLQGEYKKFSESWETLNKEVESLCKKTGNFDANVSKISNRLVKINKIAPVKEEEKSEEKTEE